MGELGLNKILGAILATALGLFGLKTLSDVVFHKGGEAHHSEEAEPVSMSEKMCEKFAYCVEIAETGGPAEAEEVFDLGALLASADASKGERVFKGQCSTCHTIESGGANGTGPNLHNIVGAPEGKHPGFAYSAAFQTMDGTWTYEHLNDWLNNPASYMRGTAMSFAGLRKDADRANVIAYLAANTENPPPFPAPLAATETAAEGEAAPAEGEATPAEGEAEVPAPAATEGEATPEAAPVEAPAPVETPAEAPADAPAEVTPQE